MIMTNGLDIDRIAKGIFVGSRSALEAASMDMLADLGFTMLVFAAREIQPKIENRRFKIVRVPLLDSLLSKVDAEMAVNAAGIVALEAKRGGQVLITCNMGVNRSPFIATLALIRRYGTNAEDALIRVRRNRKTPRVLTNQYFEAAIRAFVPPTRKTA